MATASSVELALQALSAFLGNPSPRALHGSKTLAGVFPGATKPHKDAARICHESRWIEPTGMVVGKGKSAKELYRITPAGLEAVLARSDPSQLLRQLNENLEKLEASARVRPTGADTGFQELLRALEDLKTTVASKLAEATQPQLTTGISELRSQVSKVLERIKPIDVNEIARTFANSGPSTSSKGQSSSADWGDEVIKMIQEHRQRSSLQRLTLPQVYERLRTKHSGLTLGQFHDGLRRLHEEKRVRLGPYTQALATIDEPRTALVLDREVKYYVDLP